MKKLYANQKHSLYELQKLLGLSSRHLYAYANHEYKIACMPAEILVALAKVEGISSSELYDEMLKCEEQDLKERARK